MLIRYNHNKTMEGSAEEIILSIPDKYILSCYEEDITEMRKDVGGEWENKTNQEFYEDDRLLVIRSLFDQYSEFDVLDYLADQLAKPGECVEVLGGPEEFNEENPYRVYYFTVRPQSREDVLALGAELIMGMKEFEVTDVDVKKYALQKSLTESDEG